MLFVGIGKEAVVQIDLELDGIAVAEIVIDRAFDSLAGFDVFNGIGISVRTLDFFPVAVPHVAQPADRNGSVHSQRDALFGHKRVFGVGVVRPGDPDSELRVDADIEPDVNAVALVVADVADDLAAVRDVFQRIEPLSTLAITPRVQLPL